MRKETVVTYSELGLITDICLEGLSKTNTILNHGSCSPDLSLNPRFPEVLATRPRELAISSAII